MMQESEWMIVLEVLRTMVLPAVLWLLKKNDDLRTTVHAMDVRLARVETILKPRSPSRET